MTETISPNHAAELLNVDIRTIRDWVSKEILESTRAANNRRLIFKSSVDALLSNSKSAAAVHLNRYCNGFEVPDHFDLITTYKELQQYTRAFASRKITFLLLCGSPGSGKSRQLKTNMEGKVHKWIDNHASNLGLYCSVYEAKGSPVVLDDINHFFKNKMACSLMKSLTQTEEIRSVSWESTSKALNDRNVPRHFQTASNLCLIANKWDGRDADMAAIQDRALPVAFYPSSSAIHEQVLKTGWCESEVSQFIGMHLSIIPQPSMREYFQAMTFKAAGMDWRKKLLKIWGQI